MLGFLQPLLYLQITPDQVSIRHLHLGTTHLEAAELALGAGASHVTVWTGRWRAGRALSNCAGLGRIKNLVAQLPATLPAVNHLATRTAGSVVAGAQPQLNPPS